MYLSAVGFYSDWPVFLQLPSVLWHSWMGVRKSIQPVKNWVMRCWYGYLSGAKRLWTSLCHCHMIISCFIKIQTGLTSLVPAYPGCPGKEAISELEFNVPFQHKYGYIRDERLQFIEDTIEPSVFLPGIISLVIMCIGIIWNNSF